MNNHDIIDIHSHILPCADHGSSSVEISLELIKSAKSIGVTAIAATPHFYSHNEDIGSFIERRNGCYDKLQSSLNAGELDDIRIYKGAEVTLEVDLLNNCKSRLPELCYENTDYILLEMPFVRWSGWVFDAIYKIEAHYHLIPIIAHIERYPVKSVNKLLELSPIAHINADGLINRSTRKFCLDMIENGTVHFIGSDAHDNKARNYGNMKRIIDKNKIDEDALKHFYKCSSEMLNNSKCDFSDIN